MQDDEIQILIDASYRGRASQIRDIPESYVVNDGVELGLGNKVPLWLFGFLY